MAQSPYCSVVHVGYCVVADVAAALQRRVRFTPLFGHVVAGRWYAGLFGLGRGHGAIQLPW